MRQINRKLFISQMLTVLFIMVLIPRCTFATDGGANRSIWAGYSAEQKKLAIAGFVHCFRTSPPNPNAFAQSDDSAVIRKIGHDLGSEKAVLIGSAILQALKSAPHSKPDIHAEHWSGPYGFASGLWWRGLDDGDRQAYVQGAFWCAAIPDSATISTTGISVVQAVNTLNDWYVISDDDWKDPRSNARVDVPVVVAMQRAGILSIGPVKKP